MPDNFDEGFDVAPPSYLEAMEVVKSARGDADAVATATSTAAPAQGKKKKRANAVWDKSCYPAAVNELDASHWGAWEISHLLRVEWFALPSQFFATPRQSARVVRMKAVHVLPNINSL